MLDKNGIEIMTGDVVRVSGAFFKSDNGLYAVDRSPGDASWIGNDYCLQKINRNGTYSKAKYNICFWPISCYVNDRMKAAECYEWNKEHAEIEIVHGVSKAAIVEHFETEAAKLDAEADRRAWQWGEDHKEVIRGHEIAAFYRKVAARAKEVV